MGCVCGKPVDEPVGGASFPTNASRPVTKSKSRIAMGTPVLKQDSPEERRAKQLAAAEERAKKEAQRGLGPGSRRPSELSESAKRQALIGRIQAHYASLNRDPPMGLSLASPEQLRKHLDVIKGNSGSAVDVLGPYT
jgi:hypothetical protein